MTPRGEHHVIIVTCERQQCHMFCHMRNLSQIRFVNFQRDKSIIVVHVIVQMINLELKDTPAKNIFR